MNYAYVFSFIYAPIFPCFIVMSAVRFSILLLFTSDTCYSLWNTLFIYRSNDPLSFRTIVPIPTLRSFVPYLAETSSFGNSWIPSRGDASWPLLVYISVLDSR